MADESGITETKKKPSEKPTVPRSATELQKLKLEKLMKDPDKTVSIPDRPKQWKPSEAPEFIRFVMGSSAGAGSGEFHVYRATRRREYNRMAFIEKTAEQQELDESYHKKLEENKSQAEEKTAKKRAKRQKKKQKKLGTKRKREEEKKEEAGKSLGYITRDKVPDITSAEWNIAFFTLRYDTIGLITLPDVLLNSTGRDHQRQVSSSDNDDEEKSDEDEELHFVVGGK